ncbi:MULTISPECIES: RadC family protein [unclassified Wolbachia]|uniref:JAB domain-containing protein n=1 Tax=unclassified Wolbachia TaxID=2640676 RepID=UPI00223013A6|nr:DNA repair protein RadC [Wolbachia endosymbiont (group A) of Apoderus coryli]
MNNKNKSKDENKRKKEIEFRILASKGNALLDHEIIETFLSAVHDRAQARAIAKNLVTTCTGIGRILGREMDELKSIEGVTDSTISMIFCVKETLTRVLKEELKKVPILDNLGKLIEYLRVSIGYSDKENITIIYLNQGCHLIGEEVFSGTVDQAPVYTREIIKKALLKNSTSIVISHNHPCGSAKPSEADKTMTKNLALACHSVGIKFLDHIIITGSDYFSFRQNGLL